MNLRVWALLLGGLLGGCGPIMVASDASVATEDGGADGGLDGGQSDAGAADSGALDSGTLDAGSLDAGTFDAGAVDAGPSDAGLTDAGPVLTFTVTTTALTANNTSASTRFRDLYTPASRFNGSSTPVSNGDAPTSATAATDLSLGAVSKRPIRALLYPGATTLLFVETQGWFCTTGTSPIPTTLPGDQCGSHIDIGYSGNFTSQVQRQVADMRSRGLDGVIMDWSGQAAAKGVTDADSQSTPAINTGTMFLMKAAAEQSAGAFRIAVLEDEGIRACAAAASCDVTAQVVSDLTFLDTNFFGSTSYLKQNGRPVVFFFDLDTVASSGGKSIDWATVRANAPGNPLFIFENAGGFAHAQSGGGYAWLNVTAWGSYPGSDPYGTAGFLPYFYGQAKSHGSLMAWGSAYKGFDDNLVNGWGGGRRFLGQVCGKTWLDTLAFASKSYSAADQLDGLQLITWDDYEEGSELETGIDNHLAVSASVKGAALTWTVALEPGAPAECAAAVTAGFDPRTTLDHFTVYASADGTNLALLADQLPATAGSLDLTNRLPAGSWKVYVYATAKASILNHLSAPVTVTR